MGSLFEDDIDDDADSIVDGAEPETVEAVELSPRTNPELIGHDAVEKALLEDFNANRLPHAIILAGAPGIGKATLAYRLARFLMAQGGEKPAGLFGDAAPVETLYIAPENPVFRRIASGGHADLVTIEREFDEKKGRLKNDISIDSVRRIHPFLQKTAAEGGWRVVIIDSAEYLNRNSQNGLLKILEEPPKKTLLILTTSQPGSFLPTIRSRCRMINMEPLSEKNLLTLLNKFSPALAPEEKTALARISEGSIGKALQFDQDEGLTLYKDLLKTISTLPDLDPIQAHDMADKIGKFGAERTYETAREILTDWCSRLARTQARGLPLPDTLNNDAAIFERLQKIYPPQHFFKAWEKVSQLFLQAENYNLDKRYTIMSAFLMLQKPEYTGPNI